MNDLYIMFLNILMKIVSILKSVKYPIMELIAIEVLSKKGRGCFKKNFNLIVKVYLCLVIHCL